MTQGESRLSRKIIQECRARGAYIIKIHGSAMMQVGTPDLIGCYRGVFFSMETKLPGNTLSPAQRLQRSRIKKAQGITGTVYSVRDAMHMLDAIDASMDN